MQIRYVCENTEYLSKGMIYDVFQETEKHYYIKFGDNQGVYDKRMFEVVNS